MHDSTGGIKSILPIPLKGITPEYEMFYRFFYFLPSRYCDTENWSWDFSKITDNRRLIVTREI